MKVSAIDHVVLTVRDVEATVDFYARVLGMTPVTFGAGRRALAFGSQKLNLHEAGHEFEPKAVQPTPGSADFCLLTETPLDEVVGELARAGVDIVEGPVERDGATGAIRSVYVRDPDGNLVELANRL
jgi:catechol 2,3-dioxygenase-like lactoylglutathione lyase family enzyme